jgi:hypothetical protein
MADPKDPGKDTFTQDEAAAATSGSSALPPPVVAPEYTYSSRFVSNTAENRRLAGETKGVRSPYLSQTPGGTVVYTGELLVDENNNLTPKTRYDQNDVNYEYYAWAQRKDVLASTLKFLKDYGYYPNGKSPSANALAGVGLETSDAGAIDAFFTQAWVQGKTYKKWMLERMAGVPPVATSGTGKQISVTSPEDISRQYLDASFRILGRAATQKEMQSAINWIQSQERARAAGGSVDPMSLGTAAQTRAEQASPGEAVAYKVGTAINELMGMLGGR